MKKLITLIVVLTTYTGIFSQTPQADWVHQYGNAVEAVHVDNNGYIFTVGSFNQTTFGTFPLNYTTGGNVFLYKSNAAGNVLWAKQYGQSSATPTPQVQDVITDAAGNIFIFGWFQGTATFGSSTFTSAGASDMFICKLDSNGDVLWAKKFGNTGYDLGYNGALGVDNNGNVFLGVRFQVSITIGSTNYTSAGAEDLIFIKMDTNGNVVWSQKFGGSGKDENYEMVVDAAGNSYYVGLYTNTISFGSTTLTGTGTGTSSFYIVKLDPSGSVVWAKKMNSTGSSNGNNIKLTGDGNIYVAGTFMGTVSFGGFSVTSVTSSNVDVVFSKLDTNGNVAWVKNVGSTANIYSGALDIKSNGNIVLSGEFTGTSVAGASAGSFDVYVAEYTSGGTFVWAKRFGSTGGDLNNCLAVGPDNAIYAGGYFNGTVQFDSYTQTQTTYNRAYLVRLSDCNPTAHSINETACESFQLNAETYTSSGTYTQVLENAAGCDSIITLNLTINQPTSSSFTVTECESYTWPVNNQTYTTSGTYAHVIPNANNCDSTITLILTINQPTSSSVAITECESYTWPLNNQTYTSSGTYTHVIPNATNCDSTITLNLTINQSTNSLVAITECESYTWPLNNQTYTASGTYTHVIPNANNCDSTITLNLTINQPTSSTMTQTACGSYTLNGQTYTNSGTYTQVIPNANNCDSTITLNLTIIEVNTTVTASGIVLTATQSNATYQWIDCDNNDAPIAGVTAQSFTPTQNGNYAVAITANGCTETSDCMPVNSVGIESVEQNGWSVYPNPGNGVFMVQGESVNTATIKVMNSLGQELTPATTFSNNILTIDLGQEASGVYLLEIYDGKSSITIRLLKQQ